MCEVENKEPLMMKNCPYCNEEIVVIGQQGRGTYEVLCINCWMPVLFFPEDIKYPQGEEYEQS